MDNAGFKVAQHQSAVFARCGLASWKVNWCWANPTEKRRAISLVAATESLSGPFQ